MHAWPCCCVDGPEFLPQTHTMLGTPDQAGLIPRAVEQLFTAARALQASQGWTFEMKVRSGLLLMQ